MRKSLSTRRGVLCDLALPAVCLSLIGNTRASASDRPRGSGPITATDGFDKPTFHDDFTGDDPARWMRPDQQNWPPKRGTPGRWAKHFIWGWPWSDSLRDVAARNLRASKEAQCYEDSGVRIGPDGLELVATRGTYNRFRMSWTSGIVAQNPGCAITYGYFQIISKLPVGSGLWPTFWLVGDNPAPEIDIYEVLGRETTKIHCSLHDAEHWSAAVDVPDLTQAYHKVGLLWTPSDLIWYFDDVPVAQTYTPSTASVPMYILANLAVGDAGSWPGPTDASTPSPAIMHVRSISSYALGSWNGTAIPRTPPVPPG
jgi:beta-glucanase (GH16 family)